MAAYRVALTALQGETFDEAFAWKAGIPALPVDLTGCSARMQVRAELASPAVLIELTSANGRIVIDAPNGGITLRLSAAETAALTFTRAVYDLEIVYADGRVRRLLEGSFKVKGEVTR